MCQGKSHRMILLRKLTFALLLFEILEIEGCKLQFAVIYSTIFLYLPRMSAIISGGGVAGRPAASTNMPVE